LRFGYFFACCLGVTLTLRAVNGLSKLLLRLFKSVVGQKASKNERKYSPLQTDRQKNTQDYKE